MNEPESGAGSPPAPTPGTLPATLSTALPGKPPIPLTFKRRRRRWPLWTASVLLVLAAAHTAAWLYVTARIRDGIPLFAAAAAREGWTISGGPPARAGWPLAATIHLPAVTAARPLGGTSVLVTLDQVAVTLRPQDPAHLLIDAGHAGTLRLGTADPLPLRAAAATLAAPLDGDGPVPLHLQDLVVGTASGGATVARLDATIRPGALAGTATGIQLVPPLAAPFDSGANLTLRLLATPPIPVADTPGQSAARWQAAGGRVTLPELLLEWGPLRLEGTLAGGLDPRLQPAGTASLRVAGALEVLEAASRAALVQPGPAAAIRAVLTLLTLAAHGGPIALPVTLQDRTVTAARFALLRLPLLDWDRN